MGTEVQGTVTLGGKKVNCKGDFASDHVTFSGGRRGEVKYTQIEVIGTANGKLKIRVDGAVMEFELGTKTERIAQKIRKPPTLLDKLGIKAGQAIDDRLEDGRFEKILEAAAIELTPNGKNLDHLLVPLREKEDLDGLASWAKRIKDTGALWVVYKKGRRELSEVDVLEAGREAGLKDVKVVRFTEKMTALKLVKPLAERDEDLPPA